MAKNKKRADGRYSCQVYLGKGPDGKRKYKTFYGSTLREAKAAADDFRSAVSKGMDPEQAEATLGTLYDNLIAAKKAKGIGQKSIDRLATNKAHWGELVDVPASELRAADSTTWPTGTTASRLSPTSPSPTCAAAPRPRMTSPSRRS